MDQDKINEEEWKNPANWSGPGLFSFYFSKRDTRTWVPKSVPWMGWTLNLGKPEGAFWLVVLFIGVPTLVFVLLTAGLGMGIVAAVLGKR